VFADGGREQYTCWRIGSLLLNQHVILIVEVSAVLIGVKDIKRLYGAAHHREDINVDWMTELIVGRCRYWTQLANHATSYIGGILPI
jgi:hypothetical protein